MSSSADSCPIGDVDSFCDDIALETYLDQIEARLYGWMPDEEVAALTSETAFWIERGARDRAVAGQNAKDATLAAIEKHGAAKMVSDRLLEEYFENGVDTPVLNKIGRGNGIAFAIFGIGNLLFMWFLQIRAFYPSGGALRVGYSPAEVRNVIPEWLPFPEFSWQYMLTVSYPLLAPIFLGWLCGRFIPVGVAKRVYQAMVVIILSSLTFGALLLPDTTGIVYSLFQFTYWLPVGCLAAYVSSSLLRHKRRRIWTRRHGPAEQSHKPTFCRLLDTIH